MTTKYEFKPSEQALRQVDLQSALTMAQEVIGEAMEKMPMLKDVLSAAGLRLGELQIDLMVGEEFRDEVAEMAAGFGE